MRFNWKLFTPTTEEVTIPASQWNLIALTFWLGVIIVLIESLKELL